MARNARVLVTNAYEVAPLVSGGHRRIKELYGSLLPYLDIDLCTTGGDTLSGGYFMLAEAFYETRIARSLAHHANSRVVIAELGTNGSHPSSDRMVRLNAAYIEQLGNRLQRADVVVTCHPYLHPLLRSMWSGPIVYHSHDVEAEIQKHLLPDTLPGRQLYSSLIEVERSCVRDAAFTITMSHEDAARFIALYDADPERMVAVPPSLNFTGRTLPSQALRESMKRKIMPVPGPLVVFMGSNWGPNIAAALQIVEFARAFPKVTFAILGDVVQGIPAVNVPPNVNFTGFVAEETKQTILLAADVALNPTVASSGVNMKMGEYFLSGTPVVTSPDGARGLALSDNEHAWVVDIVKFPDAINDVLKDKREARCRAENAYAHASVFFDEHTNGRSLAERFNHVSICGSSLDFRETADSRKVTI